MRVRLTEVTGIPSTVVTCSARSVFVRWTMMPGRLRPAVVGTVTWIAGEALGRMFHRSAAVWWLSTAPAPQARTAASLRPAGETFGWPTA